MAKQSNRTTANVHNVPHTSFCKFSQPASFITCSQCEDDHVNVPIHRQLGASLQYVEHGGLTWTCMVHHGDAKTHL